MIIQRAEWLRLSGACIEHFAELWCLTHRESFCAISHNNYSENTIFKILLSQINIAIRTGQKDTTNEVTTGETFRISENLFENT